MIDSISVHRWRAAKVLAKGKLCTSVSQMSKPFSIALVSIPEGEVYVKSL